MRREHITTAARQQVRPLVSPAGGSRGPVLDPNILKSWAGLRCRTARRYTFFLARDTLVYIYGRIELLWGALCIGDRRPLRSAFHRDVTPQVRRDARGCVLRLVWCDYCRASGWCGDSRRGWRLAARCYNCGGVGVRVPAMIRRGTARVYLDWGENLLSGCLLKDTEWFVNLARRFY